MIRSDERGGLTDFSEIGWGRVYFWTVFGTAFCVAVTLAIDSFNFSNLDATELARTLAMDTLIPLFLAGPILFFLLAKMRELAIAQARLAVLAATDSLTSLLNRGAFTTLVDAYLTEVKTSERETRGALLVVDADNFKSINDRFGHQRGDEALKIIAAAISSVLRSVDRVGRIGGEEFGVFLPGTTPPAAEAVAERIRHTVNTADFAPDGTRQPLSVSVGGAVFDRRLPFSDLFRLADQQLYAAKQNGRNRVAVSPITHYEIMPAAVA